MTSTANDSPSTQTSTSSNKVHHKKSQDHSKEIIKQSCGLDIMRCAFDVNKELREAWQESFEYIISNSCCQNFRNSNMDIDFLKIPRQMQLCGQTEIELHLDICQWNNQIVHKLTFPQIPSSFLGAGDSQLSADLDGDSTGHFLYDNYLTGLEEVENTEFRNKVEKDFLSQIQHATYTQTPAIIVDCPLPTHKNDNFPINLARVIFKAVSGGMPSIWLELPLIDDVSNEVLINFERQKQRQIQIESGWRASIANREFKKHNHQKYENIWKTKITEQGFTGKTSDLTVEHFHKLLQNSLSQKEKNLPGHKSIDFEFTHPKTIQLENEKLASQIEEDIKNDRLYRCDTYEVWNKFRFICDMNNRLGLILRVGAQIPKNLAVEKWLGEPVKALRVILAKFILEKKYFAEFIGKTWFFIV